METFTEIVYVTIRPMNLNLPDIEFEGDCEERKPFDSWFQSVKY